MPETPHHSFQIHLSLDTDIRGTWTKEFNNWLSCCGLWYAMKHELGENGKVHIHAVIIYEIQTSTNNGGAKVISRVKSQMKAYSPMLRLYMEEHPSKYALVVQTLKSDELIAEYMQKEEELYVFELPSDLAQLKPYFADMQTAKPKNPEYELWARMYKDENRTMPATPETVWNFFGEHMYVDSKMPIKIVSDPKRLKERVMSTVFFINKEAPDFVTIFGGTKRLKLSPTITNDPNHPQTTEENYTGPRARFCNRCNEVLVEGRYQFCDRCVEYDRNTDPANYASSSTDPL